MAESGLSGLRVFVVEDDPLIGLLLEEMLSGLGCALAGMAHTLDNAQKAVDGGELAVDAAILDVNLNGRSSRPVAEKLSALNVPIVYATGYGESGAVGMPPGGVLLEKPFTQQQVGDALLKATKNQAG